MPVAELSGIFQAVSFSIGHQKVTAARSLLRELSTVVWVVTSWWLWGGAIDYRCKHQGDRLVRVRHDHLAALDRPGLPQEPQDLQHHWSKHAGGVLFVSNALHDVEARPLEPQNAQT